MLKHELRKKYRNLRAGITPLQASDFSMILANQSLQIPIWDFFYYHIFLSIERQREVDTLPLITVLQAKDKQLIVPKVSGPNSMEHYLLTDATRLKKNRWGIPEPEDGLRVPEEKIDLVFVPLLAFDLQGNRVGYGKGFYDIFLERCRRDVVKVGLSFFVAADTTITDSHENDTKLDYSISPEQFYAS